MESAAAFQLMQSFVEKAAQIALAVRHAGATVTFKGNDLGQALTQADTQIGALAQNMFGSQLVSEETSENLASPAAAYAILNGPQISFVVDEIDGTRNFADGRNDWGIQIAAFKSGKAIGSILMLPSWNNPRNIPATSPASHRGAVFAAWQGVVTTQEVIGGTVQGAYQSYARPTHASNHVGWLASAARQLNIDYTKGPFPASSSSCIADFADIITAHQFATVFKAKLWDAAGAWPILEALGFQWFSLSGQQPSSNILDMFDESFMAKQFWLVCQTPTEAAKLAAAITPAAA